MFEEKIATLNEHGPMQGLEDVPYEKRTYTVEEIQNILGISHTSAYSFVKQGLFRTVRIGNSIRISKKSFDDWLDKTEKSDP